MLYLLHKGSIVGGRGEKEGDEKVEFRQNQLQEREKYEVAEISVAILY